VPPSVCRLALLPPVLLSVLVLSGCERGEERESKVAEQPSREGNVLRLSSQAQQAAGLVARKVALQPVRDRIPLTGWLVTMPGRQVVIRSPVAGFVLPGIAKGDLQPGRAVAAGEELAALEVLLSPQDQAQLAGSKAETEILIRQSLVAIETAQTQLNRLKGAPGAVAGSKLLELQESLARARIAHEEAQKKLPFLPQSAEPGRFRPKPIALTAPMAARVLAVHALPRQFVNAGDPLWTLADWTTLWVRVPVFEGDLGRVDRRDDADVSAPETRQVQRAAAVAVPQPTTEGLRTVDLFYALDNTPGRWRPGQAVTVSLAVGRAQERIVVPASAILWDGSGTAWAYVRTGPEAFARRRLELGHAVKDGFVVQRGLQPGQDLVTLGADVLYGEQFKAEMPTADED